MTDRNPATRPILLVGPEPLRRHLADRTGRQRIDLEADPDPAHIPTSGLWGLRLRIVGIDTIGAKQLPAVNTAIGNAVNTAIGTIGVANDDRHATPGDRPDSGRSTVTKHDPAILLEADSFDRRNDKHLPDVTIIRIDSRNVDTVQRIAAHLELTVDRDTLKWLAFHHQDDPGRLVGTLEALSAGGYHRPTRKQIELLAGSREHTTMPWHLLDDTLNGKPVGTSALDAEPIPTIAYITRRLTLGALVSERAETTSEQLETMFGTITPQTDSHARTLAKQLGPVALRTIVTRLADAEQHAKRGNGTAGLLTLLGNIRLSARQQGNR